MMKSPCKQRPDTGRPCELLRADKRNDTCRRCELRSAYVAGIGYFPSLQPAKPIMTVAAPKRVNKVTTSNLKAATKRCSACKEEKAPDAFYKNKHRKDGLQAECKACRKQIAEKYRPTNYRLTVDFLDCPKVLEQLVSHATTNERTPEQQVRYWIKQKLGGRQ